MNEFQWIKDIPVLSHPCIIFLDRSKRQTMKGNGELQSFLHQRGYKDSQGRRTINKQEKAGIVIHDVQKIYVPLLDYNSGFMDGCKKLNGYNIYYLQDIKEHNYTSNEKVCVYVNKTYKDWYTYDENEGINEWMEWDRI